MTCLPHSTNQGITTRGEIVNIPTETCSGVYAILNINSGKCYIGSAKIFRIRAQTHRNELLKGMHSNKYLQRAWDKHGEESFEFIIMEVCNPEECLNREQWWIDDLNVTNRNIGYNMAPKAGTSPVAGIGHTEETRRKMSEQRKGIVPVAATLAAAEATRGKKKSEDFCRNLSEKLKGRVKSPEHMAKLSGENHWSKRPENAEIVAATTEKNRGKKHTEEHKAKIGESHWSNREDAEKIRAKVAASLRGQKRTPEQRARISAAKQRSDASKRAERVSANEDMWAEIIEDFKKS